MKDSNLRLNHNCLFSAQTYFYLFNLYNIFQYFIVTVVSHRCAIIYCDIEIFTVAPQDS